MNDKFRFEDFGLILEEGHDHPATPFFENKTLSIPERPGKWDFGTEIREKTFNLPLATQSRDRVKLQSQLNQFVSFLFDDYGKPKLFKIVFDYEPDKYYMVKVSNSFSPLRIKPFARFNLSLIANDPYKKSNTYNDEINWDSTTATYDDSWSMDTVFVNNKVITSNQIVETYVNGLALRPDILISGTGSNVTFTLNDQSFTLKDFTNAIFLIRGKDYTCFKNDIDNLTEMTGDFLTLLPGVNELTITGTNMSFNLSIKVRDEFY